MFSLLKTDDSPCALDAGVNWQQELFAADTAQQQEDPSFLDRLAAPTVFMQQALLFDTTLDIYVLRVAIAAVAHSFPPLCYRLTEQVSFALSCSHHTQTPKSLQPQTLSMSPQNLLRHSLCIHRGAVSNPILCMCRQIQHAE